jgi:hypothetical protein
LLANVFTTILQENINIKKPDSKHIVEGKIKRRSNMAKECAMPKCEEKPKRERKYCEEHFGGQGNPEKTYNGKPITYNPNCKAEGCVNKAEGNRYYCLNHRSGVGVVNKKYKGKLVKSLLVKGEK